MYIGIHNFAYFLEEKYKVDIIGLNFRSKIQIKLFDLNICPLLNIAYVNQHETTHYADLISKFERYDYDRITQQYQRLWDLTPLLSYHPKYIPGIYFNLCVLSRDDQKFLQTYVCETGETQRVLTEINNQSKPDVAILSMAARKYLDSSNGRDALIGEEGFDCAGDHLTPRCERDLEDYLKEIGPVPEPGEVEGEERCPSEMRVIRMNHNRQGKDLLQTKVFPLLHHQPPTPWWCPLQLLRGRLHRLPHRLL